MTVTYEQALEEWGARKIEEDRALYETIEIDRATVRVSFDFNPGYHACVGPDEWGSSYEEAPSAAVEVAGNVKGSDNWPTRTVRIDPRDFDFLTLMRELAAITDELELLALAPGFD